ncbi:hypothetical protein ILYODFUR_001852 [Ilyodon furcidens]|uniref:Uncharacterized protein n=1 Tax=Ilyodon furcidens TaxID=33524 RepID=A0ABV0TGQ3_9TELE
MNLDVLFIINHYVTGVFLSGKREEVRRKSLSRMEVMESFPDEPKMTFSTTKPNIVKDRVSFALQILESSAFDMDHNCAICSASKPPMPGSEVTDWIQCDSCIRWYHLQS